MLKNHTIYTYLHKKEMKHHKNYLEFQRVYQGFKNIFWLIQGKNRQTYFHSENKCINKNTLMFKKMLNNI